jgi:hypothetical protein
MVVEKDQSAWLPEPPIPHPARRDAAIAAALHKFDGTDESAAPSPKRAKMSWASTHRPQMAMLVSVMLLVAIGIPAALISLRNPPATPESTPPQAMIYKEPTAPERQPAVPAAAPVGQSKQTKPSVPSPVTSPAIPSAKGVSAQPSGANRVEEPAPAPAPPVIVAAPPAPSTEPSAPSPPPPPPPPPQAVAGAGEAASQAAADNLVVTGSRVPQPGLEAPNSAKAVPADRAGYQRFLPKLQAAFEQKDRRAIIKLVGLPLRVNFKGGPQVYRDTRSVERDFDRIFTARVTDAVLGQRPDALFVRDQGAMVGNGELWFRETCPRSECSHPGPVRIVAVNP